MACRLMQALTDWLIFKRYFVIRFLRGHRPFALLQFFSYISSFLSGDDFLFSARTLSLLVVAVFSNLSDSLAEAAKRRFNFIRYDGKLSS